MDEDDFKAYEARILAGGELHRVDFARLSASQYGRLRNTLFLQRLARSAAIFEGGAYRGRLGARDALDVCILQLRSAFPDAAPYLGSLEALSLAMAEADAGELPELFRPGVSATDRCSHLTVVRNPKEVQIDG